MPKQQILVAIGSSPYRLTTGRIEMDGGKLGGAWTTACYRRRFIWGLAFRKAGVERFFARFFY